MADAVIRVEELSKAYRIGLYERRHQTLASAVASFVRSPIENYRNVRSLSDFREMAGNESSGETQPDGQKGADMIFALRNVSFEVNRGEVLGIIGRNGAGKSTLLKILSRITEPTRGRVIIRGRVASLLEVGTGFHPDLTGTENVYLNGTILGMRKSEIDNRFDEIVEFSGVEKFLDTPVKRYSSGMRVRLAFSVAAHLDPEILIIDEVLAVGDAAFQQKCLDKMMDIATSGKTVLFVSHSMASVQALCGRALLLGEGRILRDAETSDVVRQYLQMLEVNAQRGLLDREDRRGAGQIRVKDVLFLDGEGCEVTELMTGRPVTVRVLVTNLLPGMECALGIYDVLGRIVTSFSSALRSDDDAVVAGEPLRFECHCPELLLIAGRYRLNIAVSTDGRLQDSIENARSFTVLPGFLRGRKVRSELKCGSATMPHSWVVSR